MQIVNLLIYFDANMKEKQNIFIVTGDIHEGKSTFVRQFSDFLLKEGKTAGGFITRGTSKNGVRENFSLFDIKTQKEHAFISSEEVENWTKFKRFYFNPDTFIKGMKIIQDSVKDNSDLIILDEIGYMETEKNGWYNVMEFLSENSDKKQVWVCSKDLAKQFAEEMNIPENNIVSITKTDLKKLHQIIFN